MRYAASSSGRIAMLIYWAMVMAMSLPGMQLLASSSLPNIVGKCMVVVVVVVVLLLLLLPLLLLQAAAVQGWGYMHTSQLARVSSCLPQCARGTTSWLWPSSFRDCCSSQRCWASPWPLLMQPYVQWRC
jgi:hypothetical protein